MEPTTGSSVARSSTHPQVGSRGLARLVGSLAGASLRRDGVEPALPPGCGPRRRGTTAAARRSPSAVGGSCSSPAPGCRRRCSPSRPAPTGWRGASCGAGRWLPRPARAHDQRRRGVGAPPFLQRARPRGRPPPRRAPGLPGRRPLGVRRARRLGRGDPRGHGPADARRGVRRRGAGAPAGRGARADGGGQEPAQAGPLRVALRRPAGRPAGGDPRRGGSTPRPRAWWAGSAPSGWGPRRRPSTRSPTGCSPSCSPAPIC